MRNILVVGAGFSGACYARTLAEAGLRVTVIDSRDHIGGNAFDYMHESGTRVHKYGPHIFHTSNESVVAWLSRFTDWTPYEHRVRALLPTGVYVPLPINLETVGMISGQVFRNEEEVRLYLDSVREPITHPKNAAEHLYGSIGRELTDLFFRPYTKKMWALDLEALDASVVARIPLRYDNEDRYFPNDSFQMMPKNGYTALFAKIFDHVNIDVRLSCTFDKDMRSNYFHVFASLPIDEYFDYAYGELPYRSIKFENVLRPSTRDSIHWGTTNYTDNGSMTRETCWRVFPDHADPHSEQELITRETPCDYRDNAQERYYPVKTTDGVYQDCYLNYKALADQDPTITFIGRCGTYQYLDMHQVINQSLMGAGRWLATHSTSWS